MRRNFTPRKAAFTLIEALMALALLGALLSAAVALLFQVTGILATQSDDAFFDRHVAGVESCLRRLFAESGQSRVTSPTPLQVDREHALIAMSGSGSDLPWVSSLVTTGGRMESRLGYDGDGCLWLWWNTSGERGLGLEESHRTLISPWAERVAIYRLERGAREWVEVESAEGIRRTAGAMHALRLEFAHRGRRRALTLLLPVTEGLP